MSPGGGPSVHLPCRRASGVHCCCCCWSWVRPAHPLFDTPPPGKIPGNPPGGTAGPPPPTAPPGPPPNAPPGEPPVKPIDVWGISKIPNMLHLLESASHERGRPQAALHRRRWVRIDDLPRLGLHVARQVADDSFRAPAVGRDVVLVHLFCIPVGLHVLGR